MRFNIIKMVNRKGSTIVVTGRGGSGKSTFTALTTRFLGELGWKPLLIVDSDPDESLSSMIGVDLNAEGKVTISDVFYDIVKEKKMLKSNKAGPTYNIESMLFEEALYKSKDFDFIALGPKWFEGCYCAPDLFLGEIMVRWSEKYEYIIVDSPAGVEHLNRRITKKVKDFFNILDPSKKSFDNAKRTSRIIEEVSIDYENYYLVGGFRFPEKLNKRAMKQPFKYLGKIAYDEEVMENNFEGNSLLELSETSRAYNSVKEIIRKAGYDKKVLSLSELLNV